MLDINDLDTRSKANDGVEIEILHPITEAPTGAFIKVAGSDSDVYRKAQLEQHNRRLKQMRRGRNQHLTAELMEEEALSLLVSCTLGWRGMSRGGEPLEFSPANARALYEQCPAIRKQVDEAVENTALFIKG